MKTTPSFTWLIFNFTAFLSPKRPTKGIIWGAGPIFVFPTATDEKLGSEKWSAGPSAVALTIQGQWLYAALINNVKLQPDSNA
jgi:hypothetical protein